jgi:hypothetical protein
LIGAPAFTGTLLRLFAFWLGHDASPSAVSEMEKGRKQHPCRGPSSTESVFT